jgi:hypothetical protein
MPNGYDCGRIGQRAEAQSASLVAYLATPEGPRVITDVRSDVSDHFVGNKLVVKIPK